MVELLEHVRRQRGRDLVELGKRGRELDLELLGVDSLGFGNEQPTTLQLYLQLELTIRLAQQVTLAPCARVVVA